jgi:hypothetical protein
MTKKQPRDLPSIKHKRGSVTKREARAAVNPYMPKKSPTTMKLAIYTDSTETESLSTRKEHLSSLPLEVLALLFLRLQKQPINGSL